MKYIINEKQLTYLNKFLFEQTEEDYKKLLYYPQNTDPLTIQLMEEAVRRFRDHYGVGGYAYDFFKGPEDQEKVIKAIKFYFEKAIECHNRAIDFYTKHFSKPETISKLKNPNSSEKVLEYLKKIPFALILMNYESGGIAIPTRTTENDFYLINIIHVKKNLCGTIRHEMAHIIDYFLTKKLGEKPIEEVESYHKEDPTGKKYITDKSEIFANIQGIRQILGIEPLDDGKTICDKLENRLKNITLPKNVTSGFVRTGNNLIFNVADEMIPTITGKTIIEGIKMFFYKIFDNVDIENLLSNFAYFDPIKKTISVNCDKLGQTNIKTVDVGSKMNTNQGLA